MDFQYDVVFILGAGASAPYNYPTGAELINEIINSCADKSSYHYQILEKLFSESSIEKFQKTLRASNQYSIDAFLKERKDFAKIGKAAIVISILKREQNIILHYPASKNWLKYICGQILGADKKKWINAKLNFITFNYDRSLEYLIFNTLKSLFNLNNAEASAILNRYYIHHVYGYVGDLLEHELSEGKIKFDVPFPVKDENMDFCASQIHERILTIHDERPEEIEDPVKDYIYLSKKIFFLGFGFDTLNIQRLGIDWNKVKGEVYATAYNLSDTEIRRIETRLGISNNKKINFVKGDCEYLIRECLETL